MVRLPNDEAEALDPFHVASLAHVEPDDLLASWDVSIDPLCFRVVEPLHLGDDLALVVTELHRAQLVR